MNVLSFALIGLTVAQGLLINDRELSTQSGRTPVSCSVTTVHFDADTILVTDMQGSLLKLENDSWQRLTTPVSASNVSVGGDAIYLHNGNSETSDGRSIYRSLDDGHTWTAVGQAPDVFWRTQLYASPVPDMLFVTAGPFQGYGLYRSIDGGQSWTLVLAEGQGGTVVFSPNFARDGIAFATIPAFVTPDFAVYRTSDWGETWASFDVSNNISGGIAENGGVAFSPQFGLDRTAFTDALDGYNSLYKTTNGGSTWFRINDAKLSGPPAFSPGFLYDQTFIAGMDQSPFDKNRTLLLTRDGGRAFTPIWKRNDMTVIYWGASEQQTRAQIVPPIPSPYRLYLPLVHNFIMRPEFWLVAREDGGQRGCYLYRSRNNGASWEEVVLP